MKRFVLCVAVLMLLLNGLVQDVSFAVPILDQSYDPVATNATTFIGQFNIVDWAQTFTAGVSGTLTRIDVKIEKVVIATLPLLFDVRTTSGGTPTENDSGANILASSSIPASSVSTTLSFFSIDLSSFGISVTAGDTLAIVLRSDDSISGAYRWVGTTSDGYASGNAFDRVGTPGTWGSGFAADLAFKSFVEPNVIPEPSTYLLFAVGILSIIGIGYRQRKKVA